MGYYILALNIYHFGYLFQVFNEWYTYLIHKMNNFFSNLLWPRTFSFSIMMLYQNCSPSYFYSFHFCSSPNYITQSSNSIAHHCAKAWQLYIVKFISLSFKGGGGGIKVITEICYEPLAYLFHSTEWMHVIIHKALWFQFLCPFALIHKQNPDHL